MSVTSTPINSYVNLKYAVSPSNRHRDKSTLHPRGKHCSYIAANAVATSAHPLTSGQQTTSGNFKNG